MRFRQLLNMAIPMTHLETGEIITGACVDRESTETWVDLRQDTNYFLVLIYLSSIGSPRWCFGSLRISIKLDSVSNKPSKDLGIFFLQCIVAIDSFSERLGELLMYHTCYSARETMGAFNEWILSLRSGSDLETGQGIITFY